MSDSVQMPALGESVTEGTVTRWLKQVGDPVAVDEPLLEVSTDKVDTEIPSPVAGTLLEILVAEDETVAVGVPLARIGSADEVGAGDGGEDGAQAEAQPEPEQAEPEPEAAAEPVAEVAQVEQDEQVERAPQDEQVERAPQVEQPADTAEDAGEWQAAQVPAEPADAEPSEAEPAAAEVADAEPAEAQPSETQPSETQVAEVQPSGGATEDVRMPALGESVTEGTVTRWLKQVGDTVAVDEPLLEISTDKVDTEVPSPVAGTILELVVAEDETVAVGTVLARIGSGADAGQDRPAPAAAPEPAAAESPAPEAPLQQETPAPVEQAAPAAHPQVPAGGYLTPLVRKLAAEKGVDLSTIDGTGVGGRIRKEDVLDAAARAERERAERAEAERRRLEQEQDQAEQTTSQSASAVERPTRSHRAAPPVPEISPLRGTTEKASRLRQIIASRMVEALQSMAQLTTVVEVDVTKVARLRARAKEDFAAREGVNLSYLPFFVLAATEALKTHPKINGVLEGNQITYHGHENVGIAVDTNRGLVVPVIRDAGDLNLAGIAHKIADLAARTRDNKVTPDELSGATFTVTNTGWAGAVFDTPIVPVGTSAVLGTGAIVKRPVVATDEDGADYIAVRSMCFLSLSYDHRLVDGADASRYLASVKKRLEDGDFEAELAM